MTRGEVLVEYGPWLDGESTYLPRHYEGSEAFRERLGLLLRAWHSGHALTIREQRRTELERAQARMLQRVALGLGVRVTALPFACWTDGLPPRNPPNGGPGIGRFAAPRALLVGDRPGPGWSARVNWPFISALRSGCSAWLADQLEAVGVGEAELYWINAFDHYGRETDGAFVPRLEPAQIIALGRHAAGWCSAQGFAYQEVHHPMSWKRFHAGQTYRLTQLLKPRAKVIHGRR